MDFSEVIDQLSILNGHAEALTRGQLDIIQINADLIDRIDALTGTVSDGIDNDTKIARENARRERLAGLKAQDSEVVRQNERIRREEDGLLTTLVTGITAAAATFYGALAGIALAGTRFSDALDGASERTVSLVRGTIGFFNTIALMSKTMRAFTALAAAVVVAPITIVELISRMFTRGGVISNAVASFASAFSNFFKMLGTNFVRIPGVRRIGSIMHGLGRVIFGVIRAVLRIAGAIVPFGGILGRLMGVFARTVGRFSGILTIVMIAIDALRGGFRAWEETGSIVETIRGALYGVVNGFAQMFRDIGVFMGWLTESVVNLLPFFSSEQAAAAGDAVSGVFDTIGNWVQRLGNFFSDITTSIAGIILNPADVISSVGDFASHMIDSVTGYAESMIGSVVQTITGFMSGMIRAVANRLPDWTPGRNSLLGVADSIDSMASVTTMPSTSIGPTAPTARPADGIDMRPTERAQILAVNAPTVNQTNVSTANQSNTVVSNLPSARDTRWHAIR